MKVSALLAMKAIDMSARYGAEAAEYLPQGSSGRLVLRLWITRRATVPKDTKYQAIEKINDNGTGIASERDLSGKVIKTFNVTPELWSMQLTACLMARWGGRGMKLLQSNISRLLRNIWHKKRKVEALKLSMRCLLMAR